MALPRNSRRTASIPTTDRPPAPGTARRDDLKDNTPALGGHPSATLLVKGPAPKEWAVRRPSGVLYAPFMRRCLVCRAGHLRNVKPSDVPAFDGQTKVNKNYQVISHLFGGEGGIRT